MPSPLGFPEQNLGAPIYVGDWPRDEDFPIFPGGSKPKRMITCPIGQQTGCLIPGHSYLFKTAAGWQAPQVWSEVIAYRIAASIGLDVPPCFVAVDQYDGTTGALVEFFYGYPGDKRPARFLHGSDLLSGTFSDKQHARPHFVRRNVLTCQFLKVPGPVDWWASALAFDALIGNTDRHPENWGFLVRQDSGKASYQMAPIFDNATSLGYEMTDERAFTLACDENRAIQYIARGTHDCGWDPTGPDGPTGHIALCRRFLATYPGGSAAMRNVIRFDMDRVSAILDECTRFDVSIRFTTERAALVQKLIELRRAQLATALGE